MTAYKSDMPPACAVTVETPPAPQASRAAPAPGETLTQRVREHSDRIQKEHDVLLDLLRNLVQGDVGRSTLRKLADGQGTETIDGKTWLAAKAVIDSKQPPAAAPRAQPEVTLPAPLSMALLD
jgi:hypothetical protein